MTPEASVTTWIQELKQGNHAAAQELWQVYFRRLVGLARRRLEGYPRGVADEEDVALSAFDSFCRGAEQGRFPQLQHRDDLWTLLVLLTVRKSSDHIEREQATKRGSGRVKVESALLDAASSEDGLRTLDRIIGREPSPAFAADMVERVRVLFSLLEDEPLRTIAQRKLEGYTNAEIADELGCLVRTVERRLKRIRDTWAREIAG